MYCMYCCIHVLSVIVEHVNMLLYSYISFIVVLYKYTCYVLSNKVIYKCVFNKIIIFLFYTQSNKHLAKAEGYDTTGL